MSEHGEREVWRPYYVCDSISFIIQGKLRALSLSDDSFKTRECSSDLYKGTRPHCYYNVTHRPSEWHSQTYSDYLELIYDFEIAEFWNQLQSQ